jgi:hypothetical protein
MINFEFSRKSIYCIPISVKLHIKEKSIRIVQSCNIQYKYLYGVYTVCVYSVALEN